MNPSQSPTHSVWDRVWDRKTCCEPSCLTPWRLGKPDRPGAPGAGVAVRTTPARARRLSRRGECRGACGGINFCGSDTVCRAYADGRACKKEPGDACFCSACSPRTSSPSSRRSRRRRPPTPASKGKPSRRRQRGPVRGPLALLRRRRDCASPTWKRLKQPGNPWWHQCVPADYIFPVVRARAGRPASDQTAAAYRQLKSFCSSISAGHRPDTTDKFADGKQRARRLEA